MALFPACQYGQELTECACDRTCRNHKTLLCLSDDCEPGCACAGETVFDDSRQMCVLPDDCPCYQPNGEAYIVGNYTQTGSEIWYGTLRRN